MLTILLLFPAIESEKDIILSHDPYLKKGLNNPPLYFIPKPSIKRNKPIYNFTPSL